jgi:serine/threonine protein kinase
VPAGEGAYGKVYAGLNQSTGELMAVKVLQLGRGSSGAASAHLTEVLKVGRRLGG